MYTYKAKVLKVIDGDTIDVQIDLGFNIFIKERIRLFGINTPETRTKNLEEKKKGLEAKKFVQDEIGNKEITVEIFKQGKFGRYLANIYYGKDFFLNLNDELINLGMAVSYFGGKR